MSSNNAGELSRPLSSAEKGLLKVLLERASARAPAFSWSAQTRVVPMDDGGMGSIRFATPDLCDPIDGEKASEFQFLDRDGVAVLASLYLDANARPAELAIWKTDFSPLIAIPEGLDVEK